MQQEHYIYMGDVHPPTPHSATHSDRDLPPMVEPFHLINVRTLMSRFGLCVLTSIPSTRRDGNSHSLGSADPAFFRARARRKQIVSATSSTIVSNRKVLFVSLRLLVPAAVKVPLGCPEGPIAASQFSQSGAQTLFSQHKNSSHAQLGRLPAAADRGCSGERSRVAGLPKPL